MVLSLLRKNSRIFEIYLHKISSYFSNYSTFSCPLLKIYFGLPEEETVYLTWVRIYYKFK